MDQRPAPRTDGSDRYTSFTRRQREGAWRLPMESDEIPIYGGHGNVAGYSFDDSPVEAMSHVVMPVSNLDHSEAWYRDFVGFDVMGRDLIAEERPHSVLRMNTGQLLILVEMETVTPRRPGTSGVHQAFTMTPNQYRRMLDRVRERNWDVWAFRTQFHAHGEYTFNFYDPDGNLIEVNCTGPEASDIIYPGTGIVDCGPADQYKVGGVKLFKDGNFFLVRLREGFVALSRWCMHMNGKIIYDRDHWRFWCPYHEATYDRCGDPNGLKHPGLKALRLNPITFTPDGRVLVNTDEVIERDFHKLEHAGQPPTLAAAGGLTDRPRASRERRDNHG